MLISFPLSQVYDLIILKLSSLKLLREHFLKKEKNEKNYMTPYDASNIILARINKLEKILLAIQTLSNYKISNISNSDRINLNEEEIVLIFNPVETLDRSLIEG